MTTTAVARRPRRLHRLGRPLQRRSPRRATKQFATPAYHAPTLRTNLSPLRQEWQSDRVAVPRPARLPQVERPDLVLAPDDLPPSVARGRYYQRVLPPVGGCPWCRAQARGWRFTNDWPPAIALLLLVFGVLGAGLWRA